MQAGDCVDDEWKDEGNEGKEGKGDKLSILI